MRSLVSWLIFPLTLCGAIGRAIMALGGGVPTSAVVGFGTLGSLVVVVLFERIQPFQSDWNHSKGDLAADAA